MQDLRSISPFTDNSPRTDDAPVGIDNSNKNRRVLYLPLLSMIQYNIAGKRLVFRDYLILIFLENALDQLRIVYPGTRASEYMSEAIVLNGWPTSSLGAVLGYKFFKCVRNVGVEITHLEIGDVIAPGGSQLYFASAEIGCHAGILPEGCL